MWLEGLLVTVLAVSTVTDLKSRKIYNKLLFPAAGAALVLQLALNGWDGLWSGLAGLAAGIGILLIPYFTGGMGAGDVKLLGLVGLCMGVDFVWVAAIYMALAGAVMAVAVLLFRRGAVRRLKWIGLAAFSFYHGMRVPLIAGKESYSVGMPYGVAIAAGAILSMLWGRGWLLG